MLKRVLIALAAGALLAAATIGASYAQTATATPPKQQARQSVIAAAAAKLGVSPDALTQALKDARKEVGRQSGAKAVNVVRDELEVAAKAIGLPDARALRTELAGSSLAAVAQKHNVAPSTVANAIKADLNAKIDALVSSGKLSAGRAATLKQKAAERVDKLMTHEVKAKKS